MKIRQHDPVKSVVAPPQDAAFAAKLLDAVRSNHADLLAAYRQVNPEFSRGQLSLFLNGGSTPGTHDITFVSIDDVIRELDTMADEGAEIDASDAVAIPATIAALKSYDPAREFIVTILGTLKSGVVDSGTYILRRNLVVGMN